MMAGIVHILIANRASIFRWIFLLIFIFDNWFKQCTSDLILPACKNMHEISFIRVSAENLIWIFICVFFVLKFFFELILSQQEGLLVQRQRCFVVLLSHVNISDVVVTKVNEIYSKMKHLIIQRKYMFFFLCILPQTHSDGVFYNQERMQGLSEE